MENELQNIEELLDSDRPWLLGVGRVSDSSQIEALPAQRKRVLKYASEKGLPFTYVEFDESAYKGTRQIFREQVLDPLQKAKAKVIVAFDKIDRFTRDSSSEEKSLMTKMVRKGKMELHFPADNLFIYKDSPAADLFRLDIGVALAGYYSSAIRDNVKRKFEQKIADGEWPGKAPIGYKNIIKGHNAKGDPTKDIELDPERHELVKQGLMMRASGLSYGYITKQLQKDGLTSTVKHNPVAKTQVEYFIGNPFYMGNMRYEGNEHPHKYPRLIDPWIWRRINEVNEQRTTRRTKHTGKEFLYRDFIKCATCNYSVSFDGPKKGNIYAKCTEYGGKHNAKWVNEKVLNAQVSEILDSIKVPEDWLPKLVTALQQEFEGEQEMYKKNVKKLKAEYDKIDDEIKDMFRDRSKFKIKPELFEQLVGELGDRQADLLSQMQDHSEGNERFVVAASKILEVASNASHLFLSEKVPVSHKRRLVEFVLSNLRWDGNKLLFELKSPFDMIAEAQKMNSWGE